MSKEKTQETKVEKQEENESAETKKTEKPQEEKETKQEFNLSDEQWAEVFKHPRFKTLNERASKAEKELEKAKKAETEAEEAKLKEEKKWQELAEKKEQEVKTLQEKMILSAKTKAIVEEAFKAGIKDTEVAVKLVDIESIELDENNNSTNASEVIKNLVTSKPYLVTGEVNTDIGAGVNTNTEGEKTVWAQSDLRAKMRDHEWYSKHKEEVDSARKEGRIDYNK